MTCFNILLIGAGQLGSRHLQALALSKLNLNIFVVDPSEVSLNVAKERFEQIEKSNNIKTISFYKALTEVKIEIDLCVLATSADCRLAVLKEMTSQLTIRNILFEKVLFQSSSQLDEAKELLEVNDINAWVNCPRRMQVIYHRLHHLLQDEAYIKLEVSGRNWGLACNAIHMIDLWAYLTKKIDYTIDTSALLPQVFDSKRLGYKELGGSLKGNSGSSNFVLTCEMDEDNVKITHLIHTPAYEIIIDEGKGTCEIKTIASGEIDKVDFDFLFQSQLTNLLSEQILKDGICNLTTFSESFALHKPFINSTLDFINEHSEEKYSLCPIT